MRVRTALAVPSLLALLLGGCASVEPRGGMTTVLAPGQTMSILVDGGDGRVLVRSEGPGQVVLHRTDTSAPAVSLGVGMPGETLLTTRGRETWTVVNESDKPAAVDVRVTGAQKIEIRAPEGRGTAGY